VTSPFDTTLESPIGAVLDLRASGHGAVVDAGSSTPLQLRMRLATAITDSIIDLARSSTAQLILISGSAGGGKSVLIDELLASAPDAFSGWIEDATHSDSPTEDQLTRLTTFLAPLADGAPAAPGLPLLLAMNTGMVIRFFDQLRAARGDEHGFQELEATLLRRLAVADPGADGPDLGDRVAVVNLDGRPTCGSAGSLFDRILASLDPDDPGGVLGGAPRCATCSVVPYCWVRTNAKVCASDATRSVLDEAAGAAAHERGRWPSPRELWDLAADLVTGGATFTHPDPCMDIAQAAAAADEDAVWRHIIFNGALHAPGSPLASSLAARDPSFGPSEQAHRVLSGAGIDSVRDADQITLSLGGADRPAVETAVAIISRRLDASPSRGVTGRALVRAEWLAGSFHASSSASPQFELFESALREYPGLRTPGAELASLDELLQVIEAGLASSFGERVGNETYYRTEAHDVSRPVAVLARASIDEFLTPSPDPAAAANPSGTAVAGYRPLAIHVELAGVTLAVTYPLFVLLANAAVGAIPSTQDLERFSSLKRAAEALGREAAARHDEPLLFAVAGAGGAVARYRASDRRDRFTGSTVTAVEDVTGQ